MKKKLLQLAKMLMKFAEIKTDKGVLIISDDLAEGIEVSIEKEGEMVPAEDGVYTLEDGRTLEVSAGVIASIKEAEAPADPAPEEPVAAAEEPAPETPADPAPETPAPDDKDAKIAELEAEVAAKDAEIEALKKQLEDLTKPVEEVVEIEQHTDKDDKFNANKYTI